MLSVEGSTLVPKEYCLCEWHHRGAITSNQKNKCTCQIESTNLEALLSERVKLKAIMVVIIEVADI